MGVDAWISPTIWKDRGNVHFEAKQYKDAIVCYSEALDAELALNHAESNVFTSQLYAKRSACRLEAGDCYAALKDAGLGIQMDRSNFKAHLCKGKAFNALAKYDNALDSFEQAQRLGPTLHQE